MPTFVADVAGQYIAQLIVNDGTVNSAPDTVVINTGNSPPVANAGPDQTVALNSLVTLNGSGSTDVDGNPLTFAWSFVSRPAGSTATLSNPTAVMPTFTADRLGDFVVQLIVNDGTVNSRRRHGHDHDDQYRAHRQRRSRSDRQRRLARYLERHRVVRPGGRAADL